MVVLLPIGNRPTGTSHTLWWYARTLGMWFAIFFFPHLLPACQCIASSTGLHIRLGVALSQSNASAGRENAEPWSTADHPLADGAGDPRDLPAGVCEGHSTHPESITLIVALACQVISSMELPCVSAWRL